MLISIIVKVTIILDDIELTGRTIHEIKTLHQN